MHLRHQLLIVRKYTKPEIIRGIYTNPAWRTDNSRSLWEVIQSSPEADEHFQTKVLPDWILVTPGNSGVFLDYETREREDGRPEVVERFLLHAESVIRLIPWTTPGEAMKTLGARLLVKPDDPAKEKMGGLIEIPDLIKKRPVTGVIVDVGDGVEDSALEVGARILYGLYAGTDLELGGEKMVILGADQAMAVVGEGERVEVA